VTGLYGRVWVWAANGTSGWEGALVARRRGGGGGGGGVGLVRVPREPVTIVPATTSGTPLDSEWRSFGGWSPAPVAAAYCRPLHCSVSLLDVYHVKVWDCSR
jgi:hypothetical protein